MPKSSLTNGQKNRIAELSADGFSQAKIAKLYDVSQGTISNALKEKRYEAEINRRDQMIENAATRGVEAAIANGEVALGDGFKRLKG